MPAGTMLCMDSGFSRHLLAAERTLGGDTLPPLHSSHFHGTPDMAFRVKYLAPLVNAPVTNHFACDKDVIKYVKGNSVICAASWGKDRFLPPCMLTLTQILLLAP
jgi:hypothetical protein